MGIETQETPAETWSIFTDGDVEISTKQDPSGCRASGYCSMRHVSPFLGDVYPTAGIKACLESRGYRKEIIVISETRINPAYQAYDEFRRLGLGHVVWMTNSQDKCERSSWLLPDLGCIWSSQVFDGADVQGKMHMDRVAFTGRALRLGFNVLQVEADIIVFQDPYRFLKSPPLSDHNLLIMRDGNGFLNSGVIYCQNARPDGPTAYVLNEIVDRTLRWQESKALLESKDPPRSAICAEQSQFTDTLLSVVAGRPLFSQCWGPESYELRDKWWADHAKVLNITIDGNMPIGDSQRLLESVMEQVLGTARRSLSAHGSAHGRLPGRQLSLWRAWARLTQTFPRPRRRACAHLTQACALPSQGVGASDADVPAAPSQGVWPEELGGRGYVNPRDGAAAEYIAHMLEDTNVLWPDVEDADKDADSATITETFAFLPAFFIHTWSVGGGMGWWNKELVPHFPQVMAHFVQVPGGASNKPVVKMSLARYDWNLAHLAKAQEGVFFSSTRTSPTPDVLAYSPEIEDTPWPNAAAYQDAIQALVLLGMASNRTVAFPSLPCNLTWVAAHPLDSMPLNLDHVRYISYGGTGGGNNLRCMSSAYMMHDCLQAREAWPGGLLPVEFAHFLTLCPDEDMHVTYDRTAMSQAAPRARGGTPLDLRSKRTGAVADVLDIDLAALARSIRQDTTHRVVWLDAIPRLHFTRTSRAELPAHVNPLFADLKAKRCYTFYPTA
ncbi:MAG: hypothetical protein WDW38_011331 [Sanguina aurantia]